MQAPKPIDYDALAQQARAQTPPAAQAIDYDALAVQARNGNTAPAPATSESTAVPTSTGPLGLGNIHARVEAMASQGDPSAIALQKAIASWNARAQDEGNSLPLIGALIGTALTGGAGLPMVAAAAGGAGIGQLLKDSQWEMSPADRATNAAKSAAGAAVTQGIGELIPSAADIGKQMGRDLWQRAAKIGEPVAKTTQIMRLGGGLDAAKNEIAETVLAQGAGTIRPGNLAKMKQTLSSLDDHLDQIIKNSTGFVKRQDLRDALISKSDEIGTGSVAQEQQQDALKKAFRLLNDKPVRMTVQEAQKMKRAIYAAYERSFPAGASEAAQAMADKTTGRALRASIAQAESAVGPVNAEMSKQIPAVKAMDKALSRSGNRDLMGLTSMMAGMVTNPKTTAMALMSYPGIQSFTAQQIYNAASQLPASSRTPTAIIRLAQSLYGQGEK